MKIAKLKKVIALNIAFFILFCASLVAIIIFIMNINQKSQLEITLNNNQIKKFQRENTKRIKYQKNLVKFSKSWLTIPLKSRLITNIKPSDFNALIDRFSEKYFISNIQLSLKIPEKLNSGPYKKDSININMISGSISYSGSDDIRSLSFLYQIFKNLPGEVVLKSFTLVKAYDYSNDDFLSISKKGSIEKIRARAVFDWYYKVKK